MSTRTRLRKFLWLIHKDHGTIKVIDKLVIDKKGNITAYLKG